jgi:Domain of Unknown Function (DUF1080)
LKQFIFSTILLISFAACNNSGTATGSASDSSSKTNTSALDSGWVSLFDGQTLRGWHSYGKSAPGTAWTVDSGCIHLNPGTKNGYQVAGGGDLVTDSAYGNYDLKMEWKIGKKANSGIIFYVQEDTSKYKETWQTGMEMQVCDKDSNEDAHSYKHEAGDLYDLIPSSQMSAKGAGEWNDVEIMSNNGQLDLYLNGVHTISTTIWDDQWKKLIAGSKFKNMPGFGMFKTGHIALQDHGEEVCYRNIKIKNL